MEFISTNNTGFAITFSNEWTISVQFSEHHYCQHRATLDNRLKNVGKRMGIEKNHRSQDCEVAVLYKKEFVKLQEYDDVIGWLSPDDVGDIIEIIKRKNCTADDIKLNLKHWAKNNELEVYDDC